MRRAQACLARARNCAGIVATGFLLIAAPWTARAELDPFGKLDGLQDTGLDALFEDRDGNIWMGGNRYDGKSFLRLSVLTNDIAQDSTGAMWFASNTGLMRWDGTATRWFTTADGLLHDATTTLVADRAGAIWAGHSQGGVSRWDGTSWTSFPAGGGLPSGWIYDLLVDRMGVVWAAGSDGISAYSRGAWVKVLSLGARSIAQDSTGALWIATPSTSSSACTGSYGGSGIFVYDGGQWRHFCTNDGLPSNDVRDLTVDHLGRVWAATQAGLCRYDGTRWRTFGPADGFPDSLWVTSVLEDHSGNIWFTTYWNVYRFDGSTWLTLNPYPTFASYDARLMKDRWGHIWCANIYSGVRYFNGDSLRTFTTADGLPVNNVESIVEAPNGEIWAGTARGACRYDGSAWQRVLAGDAFDDSLVLATGIDREGNVWFGGPGYVRRFDGTNYRTFTTVDGLVRNFSRAIVQDRAGNVWFGPNRFDGTSWRAFDSPDELPSKSVWDIYEDHAGNLWFSTLGAPTPLSRFDGSTWQRFTMSDGLPVNLVYGVTEESDGVYWFGTPAGVVRYDGSTWTTYTVGDGLPDNVVFDVLVDWGSTPSSERHPPGVATLWFGTDRGMARFEPDRVPPRTVILSSPPILTTSRAQQAAFIAAYGEQHVRFSYRLDGGPWSEWSPVGSWFQSSLDDGIHELEVRAEDHWGNIEQPPRTITFEVDATPPIPVIASPSYGKPVRGRVEVLGSANDARFRDYTLDFKRSGEPSWDSAETLAASSSPVSDGILGVWDTASLPDGSYDLRLSVADSLELVGTDLVTVIVDNHAPYVDVTTPSTVTAGGGGDVYTTNAEAHLYFPPHSFARDAVVMLTAADPAGVPATLPGGATKVLDGFELEWPGSLQKPARFTLSYAGASLPNGNFSLYYSSDGSAWERLGGTVDDQDHSISLAVSAPGHYALYADNGGGSGTASLSPIAFTPRVFSPAGRFADRRVGISFRLGRAAAVTVRVFSRSGRLIRELVSSEPMQAGANMIQWDGTDRNGGIVVDGMYLVSVEALGHTQVKTLAVVK